MGGDRGRFAHQEDGKPAVGAGIGILRQQRFRARLAGHLIDTVIGKPAGLEQGTALVGAGCRQIPIIASVIATGMAADRDPVGQGEMIPATAASSFLA